MHNLSMEQKLRDDEAIDVSQYHKTNDGAYILPFFEDDMDYCDSVLERWIWSIGRHKESKQILAALDTRFYEHPDYECLWLR